MNQEAKDGRITLETLLDSNDKELDECHQLLESLHSKLIPILRETNPSPGESQADPSPGESQADPNEEFIIGTRLVTQRNNVQKANHAIRELLDRLAL